MNDSSASIDRRHRNRWFGVSKNQRPEGPPDLDEVVQQLKEQFGRFFKSNTSDKNGGNGGHGDDTPGRGGSSGKNSPPSWFRNIGIVVVILVVLGLWIADGFFIVDEPERAAVFRFGEVVREVGPGLRFRLPQPIEKHELVNLSGIRTVEIGYRGVEKNKVLREALMLTEDENIIDIQFAVQWILNKASDYVLNNRDPDLAVTQAAEAAMREVVGRSKMNYVLYEGREEIAFEVGQIMQSIMDRYGTGVLISKVTMQNAQPPQQVQAAFDDAVRAGQDQERSKSLGQAYANKVVPQAQGQASRIVAEAEGYKGRVVLRARGEAERFTKIASEYAKAPKVTRDRLYLETLESVYSRSSKILIDGNDSNQMLWLPIAELMKNKHVDSAEITLLDKQAAQNVIDEAQSLISDKPLRQGLSRARSERASTRRN